MHDKPNSLPKLSVILGGASSGKSRLAEEWVVRAGAPRVLIATAEALDGEMSARIARHRQDRSGDWQVIEEPLDLAGALMGVSADKIVLVDCLTLWLSNLLMAKVAPEAAFQTLSDALGDCAARVVLVSNETGLGLVPQTPLGRQFRDAQGQLNQMVAARAELVIFVAAGLPLVLKGTLPQGFHP